MLFEELKLRDLASQRDADGFQDFVQDGFRFFTAAERR